MWRRELRLRGGCRQCLAAWRAEVARCDSAGRGGSGALQRCRSTCLQLGGWRPGCSSHADVARSASGSNALHVHGAPRCRERCTAPHHSVAQHSTHPSATIHSLAPRVTHHARGVGSNRPGTTRRLPPKGEHPRSLAHHLSNAPRPQRSPARQPPWATLRRAAHLLLPRPLKVWGHGAPHGWHPHRRGVPAHRHDGGHPKERGCGPRDARRAHHPLGAAPAGAAWRAARKAHACVHTSGGGRGRTRKVRGQL